MLIRFEVENWMSFRDRAVFSMVASSERQHKEHLSVIENYKTKLLPISAIYGGNASGKSNLYKALEFAQKFTTDGTAIDAKISVNPFRLDKEKEKLPSSFLFVIYTNNQIYEFSFILNKTDVIEEKLVLVKPSKDIVLYERKGENYVFDSSVKNIEHLKFVQKGTRPNKLFLTNCVSQNIATFKPIYDWFKTNLQLINPQMYFGSMDKLCSEDHPFFKTTSTVLQELDTGVDSIRAEQVHLDSSIFTNEKKKEMERLLEGKDEGISFRGNDNEPVHFHIEDGEVVVSLIYTYHNSADGNKIKFKFNEESDGTQRVMDLLPAFLDASSYDTENVYFIDEIDRSLHTLLLRQLIESYLASCSKETHSQVIFTTHDVMLMDQDLMRRDEMWITERDSDGSTSLTSFSEFKDVRYDKDIRKSYLQGRMGGVPRLLLKGALSKKEANMGVSEDDDGAKK